MGISGDYRIDALLFSDGVVRLNAGQPYGTATTVTYSFMDHVDASYAQYGNAISGFAPLSDTYKAAVRDVLARYSAVARVDFVEVADSGDGGMLRFGSYTGRAGIPAGLVNDAEGMIVGRTHYGWEGDVWINSLSARMTTVAPTAGSTSYDIIAHETGHVLGLKHPGQYSAYDEAPFLPAAEDTTTNSIMSYHGGFVTVGPGPYDIDAVSYLYGPRTAGTHGNLTAGDDTANALTGTDAAEIQQGYAGNDTLLGNGGDDSLAGGTGNDLVAGGLGNDALYGNQDADTLSGDDGADALYGGQGGDSLDGGAGSDLLYGNMADDTMNGGDGDDTFFGGQGNDLMVGGAGNDWLLGNLGDDTLTGGAGADTFVYRAGQGADTITDFSAAEGDRVNLGGAAHTMTGSASGEAVIVLGSGGTLTLKGVTAAQVSEGWFVTA